MQSRSHVKARKQAVRYQKGRASGFHGGYTARTTELRVREKGKVGRQLGCRLEKVFILAEG